MKFKKIRVTKLRNSYKLLPPKIEEAWPKNVKIKKENTILKCVVLSDDGMQNDHVSCHLQAPFKKDSTYPFESIFTVEDAADLQISVVCLWRQTLPPDPLDLVPLVDPLVVQHLVLGEDVSAGHSLEE